MHKIAILIFDQVPTFELACGIEVFALPRPELSTWYDCQVVTFEHQSLQATGGVTLRAQSVESLAAYDTLIIPGWPVSSRHVRLTVAEQIVAFAQQGKRVVSFCSGAFLLAQLGLLNGRQATTHWRYAEQFCQRFPAVDYVGDVLFTLDDNMGCSAGSAAALDLSLEIVRRDFGTEVANSVARRLVVAPHRRGGQAQFVQTPVPVRANGMSNVLAWALENLQNPLSVDSLAAKANMSRRSFDRHFRAETGLSPKSWLNQQRVNQAKRLLESSDMSMDQIAVNVGFDNAITLRFNFNKYVGIAPSAYQQQFCSNTN